MDLVNRRRELTDEISRNCKKRGLKIKSRKAFAIAQSIALMEKMWPSCKVEYRIDDLTMRDICVTCKSETMEIHNIDIQSFIEMCKFVRNMEFYPLIDDHVAMGIVFSDIVDQE